MGQNKHRLCQILLRQTRKWQVSTTDPSKSPQLRLTLEFNYQKKKPLLTSAVWVTWDHPSIHAIDLTSITSFCFWMCGFAWAILPAMTSGVMVAEEVALLWILPRLVLSTCRTIAPGHLSGEELYRSSGRLSVCSDGESWEGNRCLLD